jgi:predicted phage terminase large subunit-like protein
MNWHIDAIAHHLEQVRLGRIKRLIINLPPRYLKSLMASVAFPAFLLGHDPTKRVIVVSYGSDLAVKLANDCRAIINSPRYKSIFPGLQISRLKNTESEIVTSRGGFRLAASVDGSLTGRGGDVIVIDDPLKPSDAFSDAKREHVNEWFKNTLYSRLDDKQKGAIIVVMQRLHDDDLCGFASRNGPWVFLNLPAIALKDEQIPIGDGRFHDRHVDDVLHPARESRSDLDNIRSELGEDIFAAQYQQCPSQPAGHLFKLENIQRYDSLPIRTKLHYVIQSWDTANKADAHHDYSPCVTLLVDDRGNYYVIDVLRDRLLYHQLKAQAIAQAQKHRPNRILIEEAGLVGRTLVKDLKAAGLPAVGVVPDGDKPTRASIQVEKFENGQVFFPREAPWLADFETELLAFPNGSYDDQVDALIQGLAYKCPAEYDAALPGLENFVTGFWLSKMRGF